MSASQADVSTDSLLEAIREKRKADPLIGAKVAGREILGRLIMAMNNDKGVHSESLCCALGALAGYACQASLRARGLEYGSLIKLLAQDRDSIWALAAGAAEQAGATELPDLAAIFKHTAATFGTKSFGIPRFGGGHGAADLPVTYVRTLWPALLPIVRKLTDDPALWPQAYAFAIQDAIKSVEPALAPQVALSIVMESAVPMSKVELEL